MKLDLDIGAKRARKILITKKKKKKESMSMMNIIFLS